MSKGEIVISGISGRWPKSDNLDEFWENLKQSKPMYEKEDFPYSKFFPVTSLAKGSLKNARLFDAQFFGYSDRDAADLDAQFRILHETVYESLWDAGIQPDDWRSTRTGFYVGSFTDDADTVVNPDKRVDFIQLLASRIPYAFDFIGPTLQVDTACAASLTALHEAYLALKRGQCERAIVAGVAVHQRFGINIEGRELDVLSKSGKSRCLDVDADGYVRCEAVISLVLQWSSQAKRTYATILGSSTNADGYKVTGITAPGAATQAILMRTALSAASIDPMDVDYIEGHITSTQAGDVAECESILEAYRGNSDKPITVGCVKSFIGHSEGASGLTAVAKVVKIFQNKLIPADIGLTNPNPKIAGLFDGRLVPVSKPINFTGKYIGINSFGYGGANAHVIVTCNAPEYKSNNSVSHNGYRLVCFCNRTMEGIDKMINWLQHEPKATRSDCLSLLDDLATIKPSTGMVARGYVILNKQQAIIAQDKAIVTQMESTLTVSLDASLKNYLKTLTAFKPFKNSIDASIKCLKKSDVSDLSPDSLVILTFIGIIDLLKSLNLSFNLLDCNLAYQQAVIKYLEGKLSRNEIISSTMKEMQLNGKLKQTNKSHEDRSSTVKVSSSPPQSSSSVMLNLGSNLILSQNGNIIFQSSNLNEPNLWLEAFHSALGTVYLLGCQIRLSSLYPTYNYPVSRDCPSLAGLISWSHTVQYPTIDRFNHYADLPKKTDHKIDLLDPEYFSVSDHIIDDRVVFPATGYIHLIRKHLSSIYLGAFMDPFDVSFRVWNVTINRAVFITDPIVFTVVYDPDSKAFEIITSGNIIATGSASLLDLSSWSAQERDDYRYNKTIESEDMELNREEFYQEMTILGYRYQSSYQNVSSVKIVRSSAVLSYTKNWMALADCFFQLEAFWSNERKLLVPTKISELRFDADLFKSHLTSEQEFIKVYSTRPGLIGTSGLIIDGMEVKEFPIKGQKDRLRIGQQAFTPFDSLIDVDEQLVKLRTRYCEFNAKLLQKDVSHIDLEEIKTLSESIPAEYNQNILKLQKNPLNILNRVDFFLNELKDNQNENIFDDLITLIPADCVHPLIDLVADNNRKEAKITIQNYAFSSQMLKKYIQQQFSAIGKNCVFVDGKTDKLNKPADSKPGTEMTLTVYKHKSLDLMAGSLYSDYCESSIVSTMRGKFCLILTREKLTSTEEQLADVCQLKIEVDPSISTKLSGLMEKSNYIQIGSTFCKETGLRCILYRRKPTDLTKPHRIIKINGSSDCSWFDEIKKTVDNSINDISRLWLVADDSYQNGILGLASCLALEPELNKIRCIFTPGKSFNETDLTQSLIDRDLLINTCLDGVWGFHRISVLSPEKEQRFTTSEYVYLKSISRSVQWLQDDTLITDLKNNPSLANELITVAYSSINFRDVMVANELMPPNAYPHKLLFRLGMEFSGYSATGQRIMGIVGGNGFASFIDPKSSPFLFTLPVPDSWSLAQAATVPICYGTVIYALIMRGKLEPGETVLIHAGSGGVGLAAISICLSLGCKIFTTVSSAKKRKMVQRMFPQLTDDCFADSRSTSFEEYILRKTNGRGVDVVLNSLIREKLDAGLQVLADHGRFLDLSKVDIYADKKIDQTILRPNIAIHSICLATFLFSKKANEVDRLTRIFMDGMADGSVIPLPYKTYNHSEVSTAFSDMMSAKHIGKLIVEVRGESNPTTNHSTQDNKSMLEKPGFSIPCLKQTIFDSEKVYMIIGGLGGMGLEMALWMVERNVRKLVITSRSGIKTNYQRYVIRKIKSVPNTRVEISRLDASHYKSAIRLIREASRLGPIGGIFNLAVVLRDGLFQNQTLDAFKTVCLPKIEITRNLDILSRENCKHLDYFVTFSSIASLGNLGQSNYGYANSFMERLCENRRKDGLPGLAIQWGPVDDVGIAVRTLGEKKSVGGFEPQRIRSCLEMLNFFLGSTVSVAFSAIPVVENEQSDPQDALLRVSRILGVKDIRVINLKLRLRDLGMDSVQAIEVREYLENTYNLSFAAASIYDLTLENLVKIAAVEISSVEEEFKDLDKIFRPLKTTGPRPVFFFPPAIFDFLGMLPLARGLERQVFGIDFTDDADIVKSWETLTDYYCARILEQWPSEPSYDFVSYSLGAAFAFEVGRKIQSIRGPNAVNRIVFIDSTPFGIQQALSWSTKIAEKVGNVHIDKETLLAFLRRMDRKQGNSWRSRVYKTTQQASSSDLMEDVLFSKYQYISQMKIEPRLKADALFFKCKHAISAFEGSITVSLDKSIDGNIKTIMLDSNHAEVINQCKDLLIAECNAFLAV
ncbi:fatty acid synthase isoform X2 [Tetranychus urticae]|uniref:fatty acid synthase isoform X2 n=1 Tax=Tetranychus urticae TaxID=32264 RepID=UPI00077B9C72|nr:fatty acid synthase isoform X2 [Tetranychus urticae]